MNLYLRVFLKVAEYEHITRASEELVLSHCSDEDYPESGTRNWPGTG